MKEDKVKRMFWKNADGTCKTDRNNKNWVSGKNEHQKLDIVLGLGFINIKKYCWPHLEIIRYLCGRNA